MLSGKAPSEISLEAIKDEMNRLVFMGDLAFNQAVVLHLFFNSDVKNKEKEMDNKKISYISKEFLAEKVNNINLD